MKLYLRRTLVQYNIIEHQAFLHKLILEVSICTLQ